MALPTVDLDLGRGGSLHGNGRTDANGLTLALRAKALDPRTLHGRLRSLRLAGDLELRAEAQRQRLTARLAGGCYRLGLDAERRDGVVHIADARLDSGRGSLNLFGTVGLDGASPFDLGGALAGFDPSAFGDYPSATLNASFNAVGRLTPKIEARVGLAVADSRLRAQPLAGQGQLHLSAGRLRDSDVDLRLGANRLTMRGGFGAPGDRLTLHVQAPQLAMLDPGLSGRIEARAELSGALAAPVGSIEVSAEGLAWGTRLRLKGLRGRARLAQGLEGELAIDADFQGLQSPLLDLSSGNLHASGRRDRHAIRLAVNGRELNLRAELAGALLTDPPAGAGWSGQILSLAATGPLAGELAAPARLRIASGALRLEQARLRVAGATVEVDELDWRDRSLRSRGSFRALPAATLRRWSGWARGWEGDLRLAGDWQVALGETADGRIRIAREAGDLGLGDAPGSPLMLGLTGLVLEIEAQGEGLRATLAADGTRLGRLRADAKSRLSRRDGVWGLAATAPVEGRVGLDLRSLAWTGALLDASGATRIDGRLDAELQFAGTLAEPRLNGSLRGEAIELALPEQGMRLRDGSFHAALEDGTLRVGQLRLRGGDGTLTGEGRLAWREEHPDIRLQLRAERLQVVSRPDRLLILSGDGELALRGEQLRVGARLRADRGLLELSGQDAPTLSDDVTVVGRKAPVAGKGIPYAVDLDLDLDLGERVYFKGRGLDAQLGGAMRLSGRQGRPLRATGSIRAVSGNFSAYGQRLNIERGVLNFQGPLDNPGLNILALRKDQAVEAGVAVTGTVQAPTVRLVSTPNVPDAEKLAWLVLGHGLSETGGGELDALQLAGAALLGVGESITLQQRIADAAGLEEVSLKGAGTLESTVITLGKRLSSRAYLTYEQGLAGTEALVRIQYTLTPRLSLRAQAGTVPAVDLFYRFSFD